MKSGVGALPYLATVFGKLLSFAVVTLPYKSYIRVLEANNNIPMPEWRPSTCHHRRYGLCHRLLFGSVGPVIPVKTH
jgi:hypothetical protein